MGAFGSLLIATIVFEFCIPTLCWIAPIFEFADLGVVGDLHAIVPKLTELVQARRG